MLLLHPIIIKIEKRMYTFTHALFRQSDSSCTSCDETEIDVHEDNFLVYLFAEIGLP